jgi:hypothetical protein
MFSTVAKNRAQVALLDEVAPPDRRLNRPPTAVLPAGGWVPPTPLGEIVRVDRWPASAGAPGLERDQSRRHRVTVTVSDPEWPTAYGGHRFAERIERG